MTICNRITLRILNSQLSKDNYIEMQRWINRLQDKLQALGTNISSPPRLSTHPVFPKVIPWRLHSHSRLLVSSNLFIAQFLISYISNKLIIRDFSKISGYDQRLICIKIIAKFSGFFLKYIFRINIVRVMYKNWGELSPILLIYFYWAKWKDKLGINKIYDNNVYSVMWGTNMINYIRNDIVSLFFPPSTPHLGVAIFHRSIRDARRRLLMPRLSETIRRTGSRERGLSAS